MKKVLCHGVFDVLHAGHLAYFKAAKMHGDYLVVSVTADQHVNKGPGRPYFSHNLRAEMVKALGIVDEVVISDHPTAVEVINSTRPDFYVKGPDYKDLSKDVTGEIHNEKSAVEKHGGKLIFTEDATFSSSTLINKFFHNWSDHQLSTIECVKSRGGFKAIERELQKVSKLNVLVIGEPIIDIYRFVEAEGISSKSPTVSARFKYEEHYQGGSIAIGNHLQDFCESVYSDHGTGNAPTKIRYMSADKNQRIFEVTHIDESNWDHELIAEKTLRIQSEVDVVVAADFGHGLFEGPVLEAMNGIKGFVGLNVQTNSSNFGFNVYNKHRRFDYLCLDTRESRLATHDRFGDPLSVAREIRRKIDRPFGFTCGPNGAYLLSEAEHFAPAFADNVIDATGAGDAYFAITSLLLAVDCKQELIPFIGNVFAGLKTKIIGNKSPVSKASLLKACEGILK